MNDLAGMERIDQDTFRVNYSEAPQEAFCKNWQQELEHNTDPDLLSEKILHLIKESASEQMKLF